MSDYPDSAEINAIQEWSPQGEWSGAKPWLPILKLMADAWNHDMGAVKISEDGSQYTFITGGWSGNEEILGALHENLSAHSMLWLSSHRGGKMILGVREDAKPQPAAVGRDGDGHTLAARDVLAERERQKSAEGWTHAHDDEHADGSLAQAAGCYALGDKQHFRDTIFNELYRVPDSWPISWHPSWWKPKDRRRDLVRAGALILAEIERLDRATPPAAKDQP